MKLADKFLRSSYGRAFFTLLVVVSGTIGITMLQRELAHAAQNERAVTLFTQMSDKAVTDVNPQIAARIAQIRKLPTTQSVQLIKVNSDAVDHDQIAIPLADIGLTQVKKIGGETHTGSSTWLGRLQGDEPGGTTLVSKNGRMTGSISTPRAVYRITPLGEGVHALVKLDVTKFPADEPPSFQEKMAHNALSPKTLNDVRHPAKPTSDSSPTQVDVLVAFTPAARAAFVGDMDALITLAIAEANQSYANSGINIRLNLVDTFELSYDEKLKSFDQILADFKMMQNVNQHRLERGADLAALIMNKADYCGLADAILASPSTAFAIVHYDCATGYYSFAHELGHLMGARHNEQADPTNTPFAYGHGYTDHNRWRTIMAYDCPNHCNRLQYWSNPNMSYSGEPMGTKDRNDNARVLNETATTIGAFQKHP